MYPEHDPARPGYFVYRSDLEYALQREPEKASICDVEKEFSVGMSVVSDWIRAGLIQPSAERQLYGVAQPVLTRQDVDAFRRQLARHVHLQVEKPMNTVCLRDVCIRNGKVGMNSVQLLRRILDGKIRAYHTDPNLQPFDELWFDPQDVMTLTEQVKAENNWMGFVETRQLLRVSRNVMHLWIERKILVPVATFARAVYFDRDAICQFHVRLMRSSELIKLLETNACALGKWIRAGYIPIFDGGGEGRHYFFDRERIEEWRTHHISSGELRRILGARQYLTFLKRVRCGDYASTKDLDQPFYDRSDLEHFQRELAQQL
jgi:hypothetical protein